MLKKREYDDQKLYEKHKDGCWKSLKKNLLLTLLLLF